MHLSPEDIAVAEACGVRFLPASEAQVQRLAMQRKVFYRVGKPILATRGDGFFETAGTLQQLIEEGRRQQRDLTQWLQQAVPPAADAEALPEAPVGEAEAEGTGLASEPAVASLDAPKAEPDAQAAPPKRPRQRRRRPEAAEPWEELATVAELEARLDPEPEAATPLPSGQPRSLARSAPKAVPRAAGAATERGKRWLVAGAVRRGRAGKHWSTRQR